MTDLSYTDKYRIAGIVFSLIFHVALGVLFYSVHLHKRVVIPEFAEMVMPGAVVAESGTENTEENAGEEKSIVKNLLPENIELPEKMELREDDKLTRFHKKKDVEDMKRKTSSLKQVETPALKKSKIIGTEPLFTGKASPSFGFSKPTLKPAGDISGAGAEVEKIYSIEWEGELKREILYEVMPDIKNIDAREAEIKLIFKVEPDGTVSEVTPLQKGGNIQLENASMEALKRWKFNPVNVLNGNAQQGVISFKFLAK